MSLASAHRDEIQDVCLGTSVDEPMKKVKLQEYIDHCRREQYSILAHLNSGLKDVLTQSDPQVRRAQIMSVVGSDMLGPEVQSTLVRVGAELLPK